MSVRAFRHGRGASRIRLGLRGCAAVANSWRFRLARVVPLLALVLLCTAPRPGAAADFVQIPVRVVPGSVEWQDVDGTWKPATLPFGRVEGGWGGNCEGSRIEVRVDVRRGGVEAKITSDVRSLASPGDWFTYCTASVQLRLEVELDVPDFADHSTLVVPVKWKRRKSFLYGEPRVSINVDTSYAASSMLDGRRVLLVDGFGDLDGEYDFGDGFNGRLGVALPGDRMRLPITLSLEATHFYWEEIPSATGVLARRFELWAVRPTGLDDPPHGRGR